MSNQTIPFVRVPTMPDEETNPHADDIHNLIEWLRGVPIRSDDDMPIVTDLGIELYAEIAHLRDDGLANEYLSSEVARLETEQSRLNHAAALFLVSVDTLLAVAELGACLSAVGISPPAILTHILARYPRHTDEIMGHLSNFHAWGTTPKLSRTADAPLSVYGEGQGEG